MAGTGAKTAEERSLSWPDVRLVQECLKGNDVAWSALIDKYKNLIFSVPIKYGFSREDAADIFQSVCIELISTLPKLREPNALAGWLIQVTSHKCGHWKKQATRFVSEEEQNSEPAINEADSPDSILSQLEHEQMLRQALLELAPRCRKLVHLLFFENPPRPYAQVAEELGIATGSIGFIRGRCLQKLRQRLEKMGLE